MSDEPHLKRLPTPALERSRRWTLSLIWAVPLIALLIGLSLVVHAIRQQGPTITVSFTTAEGIEPGKTKVKFKDVDIGEVKEVHLAPDRSHVLVTIDLTKDAEPFAVVDSRFWVVRPRLAGARISGLATLLSGAYIGVDAGHSTQRQTSFAGLDDPPVVALDVPGRRFTLHAADIGSLDVGSPVYFRRILVGHIESFELDRDGRRITLHVWVDSPYDGFVTADTRFWHASGVDINMDANGFRIETQSLATVLMGGIAFESPEGTENVAPAKAGAEFALAANRNEAMRKPDGEAHLSIVRFHQSVRGLAVGAPVDFRGLELGYVKTMGMEYDAKAGTFSSLVTLEIYPDRLVSAGAVLLRDDNIERYRQVVGGLVERGLRAQLRSGNLLTGQLYVALDFFPNAPPVHVDVTAQMLELPTVPSDLEELHQQIASILRKLNQVPFDKIGEDAHRALSSLDVTIRRIDGFVAQASTDVLPQLRAMIEQTDKTMETLQASLAPDAPLEQDTRNALRGLSEASRSLKALADSLERHPESLLRGKEGQQQ